MQVVARASHETDTARGFGLGARCFAGVVDASLAVQRCYATSWIAETCPPSTIESIELFQPSRAVPTSLPTKRARQRLFRFLLFCRLGPVVPPPPWRGRGAQESLMRKSGSLSHRSDRRRPRLVYRVGSGSLTKKAPRERG